MYGGLARHKDITPDAYALVLCHETGHLLGGWPAVEGKGIDMMSSEGNSDYYATYICARILWSDQKKENSKYRDLADKEILAFCNNIYFEIDAQNLCYRSIMGSKSLAIFLNKGINISIKNNDQNIVSSTLYEYPKPQCRMDTFMAGAACKRYNKWQHSKYPLNEKENSLRSCFGIYDSTRKGIEKGLRPRCWFKPTIFSDN